MSDPVSAKDIAAYASWVCIGCKKPNLYAVHKFVCYCKAKQLVCRPCYDKRPKLDWESFFGPQHSVHNADETRAERADRMSAFFSLITSGFAKKNPPGEYMIRDKDGKLLGTALVGADNFVQVQPGRDLEEGEVIPTPPPPSLEDEEQPGAFLPSPPAEQAEAKKHQAVDSGFTPPPRRNPSRSARHHP